MKANEHDLRLGSAVDAYAHLLGKVSDREIAKLAGVTVVTVCTYRNRRGIAPAVRTYRHNSAASNGANCLLCTTPPRIRGLCFRCYMRCRYNGTLESVALPHRKRGRKPTMVTSEPKEVVVIKPEPETVVPSSTLRDVPYAAALGRVSDRMIATVYNVDRGGVSAARRRRSIPAFPPDQRLLMRECTIGFTREQLAEVIAEVVA